MDPLTILSLAKGAKWAWDEYKQTSAAKPGNSIEELRARVDAGDELIRNNLELIEAMSQQIRDIETRTQLQAAELTRLQDRERKLIALASATAVVAVASLCGLLWFALR